MTEKTEKIGIDRAIKSRDFFYVVISYEKSTPF